ADPSTDATTNGFPPNVVPFTSNAERTPGSSASDSVLGFVPTTLRKKWYLRGPVMDCVRYSIRFQSVAPSSIGRRDASHPRRNRAEMLTAFTISVRLRVRMSSASARPASFVISITCAIFCACSIFLLHFGELVSFARLRRVYLVSAYF